MSDLKKRFDAAVAASKTLEERPDNATMLKLYALSSRRRRGTSKASARASPI